MIQTTNIEKKIINVNNLITNFTDKVGLTSDWHQVLQEIGKYSDQHVSTKPSTLNGLHIDKKIQKNYPKLTLVELITNLLSSKLKVNQTGSNEIPFQKKIKPPVTAQVGFNPALPMLTTNRDDIQKIQGNKKSKADILQINTTHNNIFVSSNLQQVLTTQSATPDFNKPIDTDNKTVTVSDAAVNHEPAILGEVASSKANSAQMSLEFFSSNETKPIEHKADNTGQTNLISFTVPAGDKSSIISPTIAPPRLDNQINQASSVSLNASGLAAAISAIHQAGETSALLKLNPPGLGNLSVHLSMGQNSQINILLISAIPQTVQLLHNNLDDLRRTMVASGLNLGEANVGNSGNQNSYHQVTSDDNILNPIQKTNTLIMLATPAGIRAIA